MLVFSIGRKFNRIGWLQDAFNKLQQMPITSWADNTQVLSWASPHDVLIVFRLREYIQTYRLEFICFRPPAVHTAGCRNSQQCTFLWEASWALTVVPQIAHKSYNPGELLLFVRDMKVEGMGEGCAEASKSEALKSDRFYGYDWGVDKALELIK